MIRVLIFDLGMTLIDGENKPFPGVEVALAAISSFKTADGKPLRSCLVSDFTMATPPATPAKIKALFDQYLVILSQTGLQPFFEPVSKRVTLSTQAGVLKPDRRIFEKALQRLGAKVSLEECLFITENADHVAKARKTLGMTALQFRSAGSENFDFDDWAEAAALIANLVAPHEANTHAAIKAYLAAKNIDLVSSEPANSPRELNVSGQVWSPISVPEFAELRNIHVAIPVEGQVKRGPKGEVRSMAVKKPSAEEIAETVSFVRSLAKHGQIAGTTAKAAPAATHKIEVDKDGNRRLVRKRFTAV